MITALYVILAICIFSPFYTYALYPLILKLLPKRRYKIDNDYRPFVSVIIAAYNEEKVIAEKIKNLRSLKYPGDKIEFIIGSDGSNDRTVKIAKSFTDFTSLRVLDLPRGGKVNAINSMLKEAKGDIIVFSDANTMYSENAILNLVKHFADNRIGCVSGQLRYKITHKSGRGAKSEGLYWKYENKVKKLESDIGRLSGANGAIYAVKRGILQEVKKGIINDDFYIATYVLQAGYDIVMDTEAVAYENPNDKFESQFNRHVRDGAGHYQIIAVFWRLLLPRKGSFVHFSHRIVKWLVPFLMIIAFVCNALLIGNSIFANILFACQVLTYLLMLIYYLSTKGNKEPVGILGKLLSVVFYFFSINLALLLGFIRLIRKKQKATWETQR